jgi:cytochrome c biogenesis protein CcmG/thiol:disulfide interchange protein DsbE
MPHFSGRELKRCLASLVTVLSLMSASVWAEPAPAFELPDADGKLVRLSDYKGQPLILHFWATWCPYCKKLQPGLEAIAQQYAGQGLVLLAVSYNEDEGADPRGVLLQRGHHFKTLVDGDAVARLYDVPGTPTTFFINRQGDIVGKTNTSKPADPVLQRLAEAALRSTVTP